MVCLFLIYIFTFIGIPIIYCNEEILYKLKLYFAKKKFEKYVHDKDWCIRAKVAEYCDEKYLDILVDDESEDVRYSVADYGNLEHCKKLLQDKNEKVRNRAYNKIKEIEYNELCQERNNERELKREALINNEINDKPNNEKINNKKKQYEIIQLKDIEI